MKNLFPRFSRIALKDWLDYHPYYSEVSTDRFYIDLCNELQHEMLYIDVDDHLVGADYKFLACMLVCYLEDSVSQTNMWTSFIDEHHKLYGKYLPFYDMAGYKRNDINPADIQFLVWHFCSNLSIHSRFIDPFSIGNNEIAQIVYTILIEASRQAPVNEDLKTALTLAPDANIHQVREHLDFFFFGCYLHRYYTTVLIEEEILNVKNRKGTQENIDDRRMHLLFNRVSPLLAQSSGEMLAHWAGETHPLYKNLMSLSKRKEGFFLYEGATAAHLHIKHVASGVLVELNKPDLDFSLVAGKTVLRMGIVQWDDEWYAMGPVFSVTSLKNETITEKEKCLFEPVASHLGVIKREEECFFEVNYNKRFLFLESKRETFVFIDSVWETFHLKYGMDSMDRKIFEISDVTFNVDEDLENLVIFFNPRTGMEFYANIAQCIAVWGNPYFDKNSEISIENLILDDRVSSDFIFFLIDNHMIEIEPAVGQGGYHYVWANCDFLLRYWKKERYVAEPRLYIE